MDLYNKIKHQYICDVIKIESLIKTRHKKTGTPAVVDSGVPVLILAFAYSFVKTGITAPAILLI